MVVNARIFEILPLTGVNSRLANSACREKSGLHQLCVNIFYFLSGYNPGQLDKVSAKVKNYIILIHFIYDSTKTATFDLKSGTKVAFYSR